MSPRDRKRILKAAYWLRWNVDCNGKIGKAIERDHLKLAGYLEAMAGANSEPAKPYEAHAAQCLINRERETSET